MHHAPPQPELATASLRLRPLTFADAPAIFAYSRDPAVLRYTTARTPTRLEETDSFLRDAFAVPDTRWWGLCLVGVDVVVGIIEFSLTAPDRGAVHYSLAPACWGRGLMTEAVRAVCTWAFEAVTALQTIETSVAVENVGSARVLEKVGFLLTRETDERWEKSPTPVHHRWYSFPRERWFASHAP